MPFRLVGQAASGCVGFNVGRWTGLCHCSVTFSMTDVIDVQHMHTQSDVLLADLHHLTSVKFRSHV